ATEALAAPPGASAAPPPTASSASSKSSTAASVPQLQPATPPGTAVATAAPSGASAAPPAPNAASPDAGNLAVAPIPSTKPAESTAPAGTTTATAASTATTAPATQAPAPQLPVTPENVTPPPRGSGKFLWPVNGKVVSAYGVKEGGQHNDGINIAAPLGTPVRAADNGVVAYAGNELRGFGNLLLIRHADGWVSAYAHCDALLVKRGDQVKRGKVIARVGQ